MRHGLFWIKEGDLEKSCESGYPAGPGGEPSTWHYKLQMTQAKKTVLSTKGIVKLDFEPGPSGCNANAVSGFNQGSRSLSGSYAAYSWLSRSDCR